MCELWPAFDILCENGILAAVAQSHMACGGNFGVDCSISKGLTAILAPIAQSQIV